MTALEAERVAQYLVDRVAARCVEPAEPLCTKSCHQPESAGHNVPM